MVPREELQETLALLKRAEDELRWKTAFTEAYVNSSLDGILVVDNQGRKLLQNQRMVELWKIPLPIAEEKHDEERLKWITSMTKNPEEFLKKVISIYSKPGEISRDEIELKDGRTLDRYSAPVLGQDGTHYGRIWSFRDITERKKIEEELRLSQARYLSLIEQMPAGIFRKDADGRYELVNSWFCKLRQRKPEEVLGKKAEELANNQGTHEEAELLTRGADHHKEIMRTGKTIEVEEAYPAVRGSKSLMLRVIKTPVFDADGKTTGSQGIMMDITERKRAEAALAYEQFLLNALLNNSTDKIYFKDTESKFIRCSASMAGIFNLQKAEELVGKCDRDFFSSEHAVEAFEDEQKIIRTGEPLIGKMEKETWPDGRVTWVLTTKMPLRDKAGNIAGTFGVSKDITAVKDAEARLESAHKQLMETSRQAGMAEVATSVLHNVGNVLNSVNVSSSLIADKMRTSKTNGLTKAVALMRSHENDLGDFLSNDPKGKQLPAYLASLAEHLTKEQEEVLSELGLLASNIVHIKEIVAMQQSYARASGVMESHKPEELVEDALRMNIGAVNRHNIKLVREFGEVPPVVTDKHKVLQILVNLIRNAKYACDDSGKEDKQIKLRIWNGDGRVKIAVIDNGVGIPPENLTRIFNHGFTTRKEGHGFGLHSGANAAQELKGTLTAFSEGVGHGAAFTLELPANQPD